MRREQAASIQDCGAIIQPGKRLYGPEPRFVPSRQIVSARRDMESLSVGVGRKWCLFNALHGMHLVALN